MQQQLEEATPSTRMAGGVRSEVQCIPCRVQQIIGLRRPRGPGFLTFLCIGVLLLATHSMVNSVTGQRFDYVNDLKDDEELSKAGLANATHSQDSVAEIFNRVLEKEFPEKDPQEGTEGEVGKSFNNSVADQQADLEMVARVRIHDKPKKNDTQEEKNGKVKSFQLQDLISLDSESGAEEMPTLIDKEDNVFVISHPRSGYMVLQQDFRYGGYVAVGFEQEYSKRAKPRRGTSPHVRLSCSYLPPPKS